jgi:bacteriocin biosynthesis cyclodehydratase domain-containing protein
MSNRSDRIRLPEGLRIIPGKEALFIRSLRRTLRLTGRTATEVLPRLLEALKQPRTLADVTALVGDEAAAEQLVSALERSGLVESDPQSTLPIPHLSSLLSSLGVEPLAAWERLTSQRLSLLAPKIVADALTGELASVGLAPQTIFNLDDPSSAVLSASSVEALPPDLHDCTVALIALDRWNPPWLSALCKRLVQAKIPFLPMWPESEIKGMVGPFYIPGESSCWTCFQARRQANLMDQTELYDALESMVAHDSTAELYLDGSLPFLYQPWLSAGVTEIVKWCLGLQFHLVTINQVVALTPFVLTTSIHPVLKLPRCPHCSRLEGFASGRVWMGGPAR